ncbi:unnamed protein product [Eruca vesicaria subsp. sativa]|uniref:Uncharacterized protein n=1 Tax=Eruca vesicaria subsp. sativa TaxID=29727 RepID=A0ABC8M5M6_ERUVS|nr:unnamed protein product [Eruca vesicaria subsp. sativa]
MTTTTDSNGGKTQTQTHKKQVRRRLHTSRPYQERLLNMAEARREIVTALKHHRASMRQATTTPPPPSPPLPDSFSWSNSHDLNFLLPHQPLGLNLNFHDFDDFIQTSSSPPLPTFAATSDMVLHEPSKQLMESENNVVTSALWSELKTKTVEPEEEVVVVEDDVFPKLSDVMEFPSWLNPTDDEELFHPFNLTHYSCPHNPPLSCMEFGEIEGMDGDDWLA